MRVLLWVIASVCGAVSVVGGVWWLVDVARWIGSRVAGRRRPPLSGRIPPPDPSESGRYVPRDGGER